MTLKSNLEENYEQLVKTLEKQRDELALQIHLASMDIKDDWEALEQKWEHFKTKGKQVRKEVNESTEEVEESVKFLGEEIKDGYQRIKKIL